jgi:hypothetical protein
MNLLASLQPCWKTQPRITQSIWGLWLIILVTVFGIHLTTLTISPTVWIDEVNMVDLGRTILEPDSDWSIMWSGKPLYLLPYLGAVFQDIAFRITHSMAGPRIASIFGGLLAGTFTLTYLQTRQIPKTIILLLATLCVLEPMFVQSYRGARVDSWAIAFCMGSCWLFSLAAQRLQQGKSVIPWVFLAGSLTSATQFAWISAPMLFPLIFVELVGLLQIAQVMRKKSSSGLRLAIFALIGWGSTTIFLLLPTLPHFQEGISSLRLLATINQTLRERGSLISELKLLIGDIIATYKFDPFLPILFIVSMIYARDRKLVLVSLFVVCLVLSTKVYQLRCIYLLPYIICVAGDVFKPRAHEFKAPRKQGSRFIVVLLGLTLLWSLILSLIVRPANALQQSQARDPNILDQAGISLLGKGSHKVYLGEPELYYVGRSLGWKMYKFVGMDFSRYSSNPTLSQASLSTSSPLPKFPQIDYLLTSRKTLEHPACPVTFCKFIQDLGFQERTVYQAPMSSDSSQLPRNSTSRVGALPYQDFIIYRRQKL